MRERDWAGEIRRRVLRARLTPGRETEVEEELAQHLDDRFEELMRGGHDEASALAIVLRELEDEDALARVLGPAARGRPARGGWLWDAWRDVRQGLRVVRLQPGFAAAAILALGLGTGAATAVFSLLDAIVLRPLPYAEPDRLVRIWETRPAEGLDRERLSPVNLLDYRRIEAVFADVAGWWVPEMNLSDDAGQPMRVPAVEASENLFHVLGVEAALGRTFPVDSTLHGQELEAVISDRLWRARFGADGSVLGRTIRLNGYVYTIVGVMPRGFDFPDDTDVWQRLRWDLAQHSRGAHFMESIARLRDGVAIEAANRELAALGTRLGIEHPQTNEGVAARAAPLATDTAGVFRPGLYALLGASGLLLLIACINVANLLLARAAVRRSEVAVRTALGASPARLLRQFLTESVVLAALGAIVGVAIAVAAVRGFLAWTPIEIPRADQVGLNAGVLVFAAAVAGGTALLFGLAPAVLASRADLRATLSETPRGGGSGVRRRGRQALVGAEVALAVALLAGAALLIRTVSSMLDRESGVRADGAITLDIQLPDADYDDWARVEQFYTTLLGELRQHPAVTAAGASNFLPLETGWRAPYTVVGAPSPAGEELPAAQYHTVDEGWFDALGVALLAGRGFDARDRADGPGVVIVNRAFAERAWPGQDPIGRRVFTQMRVVGPLGRRMVDGNEHTVVGVVDDVKNVSLDAAPEPALFFAVRQFPFRQMHLVLRGPGRGESIVPAVREQVRRLDARLPLGDVRSLDRVLAASADPPRFVMLLMTVFALLALVLTAIGLYGVLSFTVAQRRREIGVRLTLGARPLEVLALVLREGLGIAAAGAIVGVAIAVAGGRTLRGLLHGVGPTDPATLAAVVAIVLLVAATACIVPARHAARTDPVRTLRGD